MDRSGSGSVPAMGASAHLRNIMSLGNSIYVGFDGQHIVLWIWDGKVSSNPIKLSNETFSVLQLYAERIGGRSSEDG